jgi:HEAT repeat protein
MRNRIATLATRITLGAVVLLPCTVAGQSYRDEDRAQKILEQALRAKNPDTRKEATKALALVGATEPFATRLESMLKDKDIQVRLAAVDALAELKSPRAIEALKGALDDTLPEVRFAAAKVLFKLNDPAGRMALIAVLEGRMKTSSGFISEQVREQMRLLETPRPLLIIAMKQGIGFAHVPYLDTGVSLIVRVTADSGRSARAATALLLGNDRDDPEVIPAFRKALQDKDASVRAAAVQAIALRDELSLKEDVARLLSDKNQNVRLRAAAGYLRLEIGSAAPDGPGNK